MEIEIDDRSIETKAVTSADTHFVQDEMMRTFEALKATNEEQLASLARQNDKLIEEKYARIDEALNRKVDELSLKSARPALSAENKSASSFDQREHKNAFVSYMRNGETAGLRQLETKALSVGSNPDGGFVVPVEIENQITARLTAISPIRAIAGVRVISGNVFKKPFMTAGPAVGWVGETDARTQTTSPTLDALSFPAMELYAMPAATATLLEDAAVNIDQWLAAEVEQHVG
jgi:HK97 family phage major capsid protein